MRPPLIIGGGPAGALAALTLRAAGQPALLVERLTGPSDKVCGDFIGAAALRLAREHGVDPAELGGSPITQLRIVHRRRVAATTLPFGAYGLSRRLLDEALLTRAAAAGTEILRGHAVRSLREDGPDLVVRADGLGDIRAGAVFLASGKHDLHGLPRPAGGGNPVGLKMYLRLNPRQTEALSGAVELVLFRGGYAGLQRIEGGRAVLCLLLADGHRAADWQGLLVELSLQAPHLAMRLEGATPLLDRPLAIARIPYGFLHRSRAADHDGLFRVGDQAAVIPSLTGDGVSIAMRSAVRAAEAWMGGAGATEYHRRLRAMLWPRMRVATLLQSGFTATHAQELVTRAGQVSPGGMRLAAQWSRLRA